MRSWIIVISLLVANSIAFADGAEWVQGEIKSINPIQQIIILSPDQAIAEDSVIEITVDENTIFTDVESFNRLKVGQKLRVEIYDDETSPKKIAREVVLVDLLDEANQEAIGGFVK